MISYDLDLTSAALCFVVCMGLHSIFSLPLRKCTASDTALLHPLSSKYRMGTRIRSWLFGIVEIPPLLKRPNCPAPRVMYASSTSFLSFSSPATTWKRSDNGHLSESESLRVFCCFIADRKCNIWNWRQNLLRMHRFGL